MKGTDSMSVVDQILTRNFIRISSKWKILDSIWKNVNFEWIINFDFSYNFMFSLIKIE